MKKKIVQGLGLSLLTHALLSGYTLQENGSIDWQFLAGSYTENYDGSGIPLNINAEPSQAYSDQFWQDLSFALPEGKDIRQTNPDYITDDKGGSVKLSQEADLFVTFLHEGAGYKNSFGYFTYDENNPPTSKAEVLEKVVFPNASFHNSGGSDLGLRSGDTMNIGRFPAGTRVGFVVVSNGFHSQQGVKAFQDTDWIFYTLKDLNAEADPKLKAHTVLLYDAATQSAVIGLEDILRTNGGCDHDFNDVLFTVRSNPPEALVGEELITLPESIDSDSDGVQDVDDIFPNDPQRAFKDYYPEAGQSNTLAFEDNWPAQGDYDMNDLVLKYNMLNTLHANGHVKDIQFNFSLVARGASLHNAFAIEIPNVSADQVKSAVLIHDGQSQNLSPEAGQKNLVYTLLEDAHDYSPAPQGCKFFNTEETDKCPAQAARHFELKIEFNSPQSRNKIGFAPYNPFIYRKDQRGMEVHLPNHTPTQLANTGMFGSRDDNSNATSQRYYKTKSNLPWAMDVPSDWSHPKEELEVSSAYLNFGPWAESGGTNYQNWYQNQMQAKFIFPHVAGK